MTRKEKQEELARDYAYEFAKKNKDLSNISFIDGLITMEDDIKQAYMEGAAEADASFKEKALRWYCRDCECNDDCKANHHCYFIYDFQEFLDEKHKTLPPKGDGLRFKRFRRELAKDITEFIDENIVKYASIDNDKKKLLMEDLQKFTNRRIMYD